MIINIDEIAQNALNIQATQSENCKKNNNKNCTRTNTIKC